MSGLIFRQDLGPVNNKKLNALFGNPKIDTFYAIKGDELCFPVIKNFLWIIKNCHPVLNTSTDTFLGEDTNKQYGKYEFEKIINRYHEVTTTTGVIERTCDVHIDVGETL